MSKEKDDFKNVQPLSGGSNINEPKDDLIVRFDDPEEQAKFTQSARSVIKRAPTEERANKYFELLAKDTYFVQMVEQHLDMMDAVPLNAEDFAKVYLYGIGLAQGTIRNLSYELLRFLETYLGNELKYYETRDEHLQGYFFWLQKYLKQRVDRAQQCMSLLLQAYGNIKKKDPLFSNQYDKLKETNPRLYKMIVPEDIRGDPKRSLTEEELIVLYSYLLKRVEEAPEKLVVNGQRTHMGTKKFYRYLYAYFRFAFSGGMRAGEINSLEWNDLHKDESTGAWYAIIMKSKGRTHPVEQELADSEAISILKDYYKEYMDGCSGLLFPSLRKLEKLTRVNWFKYMEFFRKELLANKILDIKEEKELGNTKIEFSVHLFRRTAGSLLYREDMKIEQVAKWLRHKGQRDYQVTTDHYVNVKRIASPYMQRIVKRINNSLV